MKLTEPQWAVMEILWSGERFALKEITDALKKVNGWNKNTVYTYLTRMKSAGLVNIDRTQSKPYSAAVTREHCAEKERDELLNKVYAGAAGDLIAAFLKESTISPEEVKKLKRLLDEMEV